MIDFKIEYLVEDDVEGEGGWVRNVYCFFR